MKTTRHPETRPHHGDPEYVKEQAAGRIYTYRSNILEFMKDMWGLVPQPVKPEYQKQWQEVLLAQGETWLRLKNEVKAEWFGDITSLGQYNETYWSFPLFVKGRHISWQQTLILLSVQKAIEDKRLSRHISVRSGHGIGKSTVTSWIVIWFLYCYFMSQVPVTAPTASQMHDVLWKELAIWLERMPQEVGEMFEWQHDYIRVRYKPESWFARAKTSSKENTEALAGVHADNVLMAVDEASGVPEQVFNTAEGALTSGNVFVIMISNPTRTIGYFYDSHHKNATDWQTFSFNCEEAPLVDRAYVERQAKRHGVTSDEYKIRVKGMFPSEDAMDDSGFMQLVPRSRIIVTPSLGESDMFVGRKILAIDPSGEGDDECEFVIRDILQAKIVKTMTSTNDKEIAAEAYKLCLIHQIQPKDVVIEGFGKGADAAKNLVLLSKGYYNPYVVLPGTAPSDEEKINGEYFVRFEGEYDDKAVDLMLNLRATAKWRMRNWLIRGGMLIDNNTESSDFAEQIAMEKYQRVRNKIQIMPKKQMFKLRIPSPNKSDALSLSFLVEKPPSTQTAEERAYLASEQQKVDNPFSVL